MLNQLTIKPPYSERQWQLYYQLRWNVLRKPWGQTLGSERDDLEASATHLLARFNNHAAGVGRIHTINDNTAQIRYMAVEDKFQRMEIGANILLSLEKTALNMGIKTIHLNARTTHHAFYLKHGYEITGEGHTLYNEITHLTMSKALPL